MEQVLRQELEPLGMQDRVHFHGAPLNLQTRAAQALSMIAHELATNAAKYGAFSCDTGRVDLSWRIVTGNGEDHFEFVWREYDGPPLNTERDDEKEDGEGGFGTKLIDLLCRAELRGKSETKLSHDGLVFKLTAPCTEIVGDTSLASAAEQHTVEVAPSSAIEIDVPAAEEAMARPPSRMAPMSDYTVGPHRFVALADMWPVSVSRGMEQEGHRWQLDRFVCSSAEFEALFDSDDLPTVAVIDLSLNQPLDKTADWMLRLDECGVRFVVAVDDLNEQIPAWLGRLNGGSSARLVELLTSSPRVQKPFGLERLCLALDLARA